MGNTQATRINYDLSSVVGYGHTLEAAKEALHAHIRYYEPTFTDFRHTTNDQYYVATENGTMYKMYYQTKNGIFKAYLRPDPQ